MCATLWPPTLWLYCGSQALWATLTLPEARFTALQVVFDTHTPYQFIFFLCSLFIDLLYMYCTCFISFLFTASILALSTLMFVVRIALIVWRHYKQPLYSSSEPNLSPVQIALTQRKLFLWSFIQLSLFVQLSHFDIVFVDEILVSYFAIFK